MENDRKLASCRQGISAALLSSWRDGGVSAAQVARLEAHVPDCPACRQILAEYDQVATALRAQPELEPGERILEGVRTLMATSAGGRWARSGRRQILSGLGSLAAVLVLAGLFGALLGSHFLSGQTSQISPTPTSLPATPSPTPGIYSQTKSYQTAWGPSAVSATESMTLDSTHAFLPMFQSADGTLLLGDEEVSSGNPPVPSSSQAGFYDLSTHRFTAIGLSDGFPTVACCMSDGRFLVARDSTNPEATGSLQYFRLWAYDQQIGRLRLVATASQFGGGLNWGPLSHGLLLMNTNDGLEMADLAAETITPLHLLDYSAFGGSVIVAFAWPYLIYQAVTAGGQSTTITRLYNFETRQSTILTALQSLLSTFGPQLPQLGYLIAGDSLYVSALTGQNGSNPTGGITTLYELDHVLSGGTTYRTVVTFNGNLGSLEGANSRLIAFQGAVWDSTLHTFVSFPGVSIASGSIPISVAGNTLVVVQVSDSGAATVLVFDTTKLRTSSG